MSAFWKESFTMQTVELYRKMMANWFVSLIPALKIYQRGFSKSVKKTFRNILYNTQIVHLY